MQCFYHFLLYFTTLAPNPASANAVISTSLLRLLFTITFRSKTETETISNSPSTVSSADRTFSAQPPQSIPLTVNAITSGVGLHPIHSILASTNNTNDIRVTVSMPAPPTSHTRCAAMDAPSHNRAVSHPGCTVCAGNTRTSPHVRGRRTSPTRRAVHTRKHSKGFCVLQRVSFFLRTKKTHQGSLA